MAARPSNLVVVIGVIVLAAVVVLVAVLLDPPASVFVLAGIAIAAAFVAIWFGTRADRR